MIFREAMMFGHRIMLQRINMHLFNGFQIIIPNLHKMGHLEITGNTSH